MRIKCDFKNEVKVYNGIIYAKMKQKYTNPVLQTVLNELKNNNFNMDNFKDFKEKYINALKEDGYIDNSKNLTQKGEETAKSGKELKELEGFFDCCFVKYNDICYLLSCKLVDSKNRNDDKLNQHNAIFRFPEVVNECNDNYVEIERGIEGFFDIKEDVADSCYIEFDFSTKSTLMSINYKKNKYEIKVNSRSNFRILDYNISIDRLNNDLQDTFNANFFYDKNNNDNIVIDTKIHIDRNEYNYGHYSELIQKGINNKNKISEYRMNNGDILTDFSVKIANKDTAINIIVDHILNHMKDEYIGIGRVWELKREIESSFDCEDLCDIYSKDIYEKEIDCALKQNRNNIEYLHYQAVNDLDITDIENRDRGDMSYAIHFTNEEITWAEFFDRIFEKLLKTNKSNIKRIESITKYYNNPDIRKNYNEIYEALLSMNIGFKVIVLTNNEYELKNSSKIPEFVEIKSFKNIHNRFWKIVLKDQENPIFLEAPIEVNDRRYDKKINKEKFKEMTITVKPVDYLPEDVKKIFGVPYES